MNRIQLRMPAFSFSLTRDDKLLVAATVEFAIDVYDAASGEYLRTLTDFGQETPLIVHGTN